MLTEEGALAMKKCLLWVMMAVIMSLASGAVADSRITTKRFPDDFTNLQIQQRPQRATFSLDGSLTMEEALEQGVIPKADKERLKSTVTAGLDADITYADGLITVRVDMDESKWDKVMASSDLFPYVMLWHTLDRPSEAYETHAGFSGDLTGLTLDYMITLMEETMMDWNGDMTQAGNGEMLGEIIPAQSMLVSNRKEGFGESLICWMDADTQEVYYEYYKIVYILSDDQPRYVPFRYVTEDMLAPTRSAQMPNGIQLKQIKDGDITFRITGTEENYEVPITLKAPQGAASVEAKREGGDRVRTEFAGGEATFYFNFGGPGVRTHEAQYTVNWYNAAGEVIEYGVLMCHAEPADYAPWPYYSREWSAPASNRLVRQNGSEKIGVTLDYNAQKGVVHVGYDQNAAVTGDLGSIYVGVKAPEGAAYYRQNESGGNNIMGEDEYAGRDQLAFTSEQELQPVPESGIVTLMDYEPLCKYIAGPLEVYVQMEVDAWPYSGGIYSIFWYESEEAAYEAPDEPMLIEYVARTTGSMCTVNRVPVVETEAEITEPVKEVTCVGGKHYQDGWRLVVRRYPHKGSKAFHYELTMENQYGAYQPLQGKMVFYMPYPNDYYSHPEYTFSLQHFSSDYESYQLVDVQETDYGLRFEVSSLSPFVLSYEEELPATPLPQIPQTGDAAPLSFYWLMMALGALLLAGLRRKSA